MEQLIRFTPKKHPPNGGLQHTFTNIWEKPTSTKNLNHRRSKTWRSLRSPISKPRKCETKNSQWHYCFCSLQVASIDTKMVEKWWEAIFWNHHQSQVHFQLLPEARIDMGSKTILTYINIKQINNRYQKSCPENFRNFNARIWPTFNFWDAICSDGFW